MSLSKNETKCRRTRVRIVFGYCTTCCIILLNALAKIILACDVAPDVYVEYLFHNNNNGNGDVLYSDLSLDIY